MNVYQARQRLDGRWDFTLTDGSGGRGVGYCNAVPVPGDFEKLGIPITSEDRDRWELHKDKYHTTGHESKEAAEECYRQYVLDNRTTYDHEDKNQQRKCAVCGEWTTKYAMVGDYKIVCLCDDHRNRHNVEALVNKPSVIFSS
jgi:hypothetical protein